MASACRALVGLVVAGTLTALGVQLALHLVAWRRTPRAAGAPHPDDATPAALRLWTVLRETALSLVLLLAWPWGRGAADARRGHLVVLVHGFACPPGGLSLLARRLRRDGWSVATPGLGRWWPDLDTAAARLERQLAALRRNRPASQLVVVAHGVGGLAVRLLLARAPLRSGIRLLVTLGTPHQGTEACPRFRLGPFRDDVRPDSATLRALRGTPLPAGVEAIAIASPDDAVVVPPERARWTEGCNVSIRGQGHLHLLFSSRVYEIVAENLAPTSAPARCGRGA